MSRKRPYWLIPIFDHIQIQIFIVRLIKFKYKLPYKIHMKHHPKP